MSEKTGKLLNYNFSFFFSFSSLQTHELVANQGVYDNGTIAALTHRSDTHTQNLVQECEIINFSFSFRNSRRSTWSFSRGG